MDTPIRLGILFSGGATTATAIFRACMNGVLKGLVEIVFAATNRPDAGGIERLKAAGLAADRIHVLPTVKGETPDVFGARILRLCGRTQATFLGQYGWTRWTPDNVTRAFEGRMINQHPGPLDPGYPGFGGRGMRGLAVHEAVLQFARMTGRLDFTEATAQRVDQNYDEGKLLHIRTLVIKPDDTAETLSARLLPEEHMTQIETLFKIGVGQQFRFKRRIRLIATGDIPALDEAKRLAIEKYPHG